MSMVRIHLRLGLIFVEGLIDGAVRLLTGLSVMILRFVGKFRRFVGPIGKMLDKLFRNVLYKRIL